MNFIVIIPCLVAAVLAIVFCTSRKNNGLFALNIGQISWLQLHLTAHGQLLSRRMKRANRLTHCVCEHTTGLDQSDAVFWNRWGLPVNERLLCLQPFHLAFTVTCFMTSLNLSSTDIRGKENLVWIAGQPSFCTGWGKSVYAFLAKSILGKTQPRLWNIT